MRITSLVAALLLIPSAASASARVAVLPVSYTIYKTNSPSEERALKVSDAVAAGVTRAGLEPVRGDAVTSASRDLAPDGEEYCREPACAREVADRVGAMFALVVSVVDKDGQFEIEVLGTDSEPISASPFGTFKSMTRRVSGLVETSVRDAVSTRRVPSETTPAAAPEPETVPAAAEAEPGPPSDAAPKPDRDAAETSEDGLSPAPFIASAALTGALAAGWVAIEVIGYNKTKDAEDKSQYKSLQIGSRVLLGCAAAGVVTSVVLFVLTDFDTGEKSAAQRSRRWFLAPAPLRSGGALVVEGRF